MRKLFAVLVFLVVLASGCVQSGHPAQQETAPGQSPVRSADSITFIVTVPATTPPEDTIVLHYNYHLLPLTPAGNNQYRGVLNKSQFSEGETVMYGYSRGGFWPFGENGFEGTGHRKFVVGERDNIEDTVAAWKWLPSQPLRETDITTIADSAHWAARPRFWKGVQFVDFWSDEFPFQYNASIVHLQKQGYKWIELAPPWDIRQDTPPIIAGVNVSVPAYPDGKLREHVRVFRQAGFKVMFRIQVCCTPISGGNRSDAWWQQWYDQWEVFVQHYADLAREEGVDAIVLSYSHFGLPLDPDSPSFASQRWEDIIGAAKSSGALVGYETLAWSPYVHDPGLPWPGDAIDFWDELDFVGVSLWSGVVNTTHPTQQDVDNGMEGMFHHLDTAHEQIQKPFVIIGVAYESREGAGLPKGPEDFSTWEDPETVTFTYSAEEQAMIYEAVMRQAAERDYIRGVFPFGYWYADAPLTVDMSIRGKMAERILAKWFASIPD